MKGKILGIGMALVALTLALRFIPIEVDAPRKVPPARICRAAGAAETLPATTSDGEPLADCAELDAINQAYLRDIKPIFAAKCLMCHGAVPKMPLYAKVPPSSWLVSHDIEEAQSHIDMTFDFPFDGHHVDVPQEALEEIIEVVDEASMPPFVYKIMHWHSGLTVEEAKKILAWANAGLKTLND